MSAQDTHDASKSTARAHFSYADLRFPRPVDYYVAYLMNEAGDDDAKLKEHMSKSVHALFPFDDHDRIPGVCKERAAKALQLHGDQIGKRLLEDHVVSSSIQALPFAGELAFRVLGITSDHSVAHLSYDFASFLPKLSGVNPKKVYACSEERESALFAAIVAQVAGLESVQVEERDLLQKKPDQEFDRIFASLIGKRSAAGLRRRNSGLGYYYLSGDPYRFLTANGAPKAGEKDPIDHPFSGEWLYFKAVSDYLADGGLGAVVMQTGQLINGRDARTRAYFVKENMLRAVIALPAPERHFNLCLLILGAPVGGRIRFVDATSLGEFTDDVMDEILDLYKKEPQEGDKSVFTLDKDELEGRCKELGLEYSLSPSALAYERPALGHTAPLPDLGMVFRGHMLSREESQELVTSKKTGYRYMTIANIQDGLIDDDLPYLSKLPLAYEKDGGKQDQLLKEGDLVITRSGYPVKVAIATSGHDQGVLPTGNLFVVRLNKSVIDPYFVAAYLNSDEGQRALDHITVGNTIASLPLKNLKTFELPVPALDQQNRIATKYRMLLDQIRVLKSILKGKKEDASKVFSLN